MTQHSAVETYYNGFKFRSRAEARWAVFFDSLDIEYHYEPEKFQCGDTRYIPDFFLPRMEHDPHTDTCEGVYFEVKGAYPTEEEILKASWLVAATHRHVYIFHGSRFDGGGGLYCWGRIGPRPDQQVSPVIVHQCPFCGVVEFKFAPTDDEDGSSDEIGTASHACLEECSVAKQYDVDSNFLTWQDLTSVKAKRPRSSPMLDLAFQAAKSARFESQEHMSEIAGFKAAIKTLRASKTWCFPSVMADIHKIAAELRQDPNCPHYDEPYGEPYFVAHLEHLRTKREGPCPCYSCEYTRRRESQANG